MATTPPKARSTRSHRIAPAAGVLTALITIAAPVALPTVVRAEEPVRSGTILGGVGETPISPWVRGMEGCVGAPSCSAWLQSGCAPELSGVEPALQASVVDVEDLADNSERTLTLLNDVVVFGARYTVQFWTESHLIVRWDWCEEIFDLRFRSWECFRHIEGTECEFRIPPQAKWMTITSTPEGAKTSWSLV